MSQGGLFLFIFFLVRPVCSVAKFSDFKEAIERVNASAYGLQAGVFTSDLRKAFYAYENLHTVPPLPFA
jgi:acyl-CoA reductase-like NAD-dependent aldehyde dehydrogenase